MGVTSEDTSRLCDIVEAFTGTKMLVVGDLILDHYVWGDVDRISPEAPVVVVKVSKEEKRPGGAGNVANNLAALGADVSVCGVVGDDEGGRDLLSLLETRGVETSGVLVDRSRPSTRKTRVIARSQQVVRVDREEPSPLSEAHREGISVSLQSHLKNVRGVLVSDYAKGVVCPSVFQKIEAARDSGIVGLGKVPVVVDPKAPNLSIYAGATVIKPNRSEAEEATGVHIDTRSKAVEAGGLLVDRWACDAVLITLGEMGMVLVSGPGEKGFAVEIDTVARNVYDVSGAGDTVLAVFGLALSVGARPKDAAVLANYAAGMVVGEVGTVALDAERLLSGLE